MADELLCLDNVFKYTFFKCLNHAFCYHKTYVSKSGNGTCYLERPTADKDTCTAQVGLLTLCCAEMWKLSWAHSFSVRQRGSPAERRG